MHITPRRAVAASMLLAAALLASCRMPAFLRGRPRPASAAQNAVCYQCHIDFQGEELSQTHESHDVSCVRCHGTSKAHMDDEVRKTPPDALFRGPAMQVFCLTCHDPAEHARVAAHAANAKEPADQRKLCTACHGEHKLVRVDAEKNPF